MAEKLDQIQLLHQALTYRGRTLEWLSGELTLSVKTIFEIMELGNVRNIREISNLLELPMLYFWGGYQVVNGELVEINTAADNNPESLNK